MHLIIPISQALTVPRPFAGWARKLDLWTPLPYISYLGTQLVESRPVWSLSLPLELLNATGYLLLIPPVPHIPYSSSYSLFL